MIVFIIIVHDKSRMHQRPTLICTLIDLEVKNNYNDDINKLHTNH